MRKNVEIFENNILKINWKLQNNKKMHRIDASRFTLADVRGSLDDMMIILMNRLTMQQLIEFLYFKEGFMSK